MVQFKILALAATATLSLAACGTSNKATPAQSSANPTSSASAPTQPPTPGKAHKVAGLIASVTGDTIQVTQPNGSATVDVTPSTTVSEITAAGLPDVTPGSCVTVRPTQENPAGGTTITAASVRVSPAVNNKCPEPKQPPAGARSAGLQGTVASVAGNTITVSAGGTPPITVTVTVTVTDQTKYTKGGATNSHAIAQGKCITARGTQDSGGALQASTIRLRPATNGTCPAAAGQHHR